MNYEIRELTAKLVQVLNEYDNVPIEVKKYIIKDIYTEVEKLSNNIVLQEIQARNEQNNEKNKTVSWNQHWLEACRLLVDFCSAYDAGGLVVPDSFSRYLR